MAAASPIVIKVGGHEIGDPAFLSGLAATVRDLSSPVIIVHGGGDEISQLQTLMQIEPRYQDGLRITDAKSLSVVEMVLCGLVNKRVVRTLIEAGVDALGLSGVDRGLVRGRAVPGMEFTGEVVAVRGDILRDLLTQRVTPVVAPVCLGEGSSLNVNADHVAGAIGGAVGAARVVFITNVEGVLVEGKRVDTLTVEQSESLIADGTIFGGMIPKVRTALDVLARGVSQTVITNLAGLQSGTGTVFVANSAQL
ncbi:MAG: acetylglutamate kinase [bacterium]|nr:acetylglutamate kinase [bacterium]